MNNVTPILTGKTFTEQEKQQWLMRMNSMPVDGALGIIAFHNPLDESGNHFRFMAFFKCGNEVASLAQDVLYSGGLVLSSEGRTSWLATFANELETAIHNYIRDYSNHQKEMIKAAGGKVDLDRDPMSEPEQLELDLGDAS